MKLYGIHWMSDTNERGRVDGDGLPYKEARKKAEELNESKLNKKLKLRYYVVPEKASE